MRRRFRIQIGALKMLLLQINAMCTLLLIVANPGSTFFVGKFENIISSENLLPCWTCWSYNNWGTKWLNWLQAWNLSMSINNWIKTWIIELKLGLLYKKNVARWKLWSNTRCCPWKCENKRRRSAAMFAIDSESEMAHKKVDWNVQEKHMYPGSS